MSHRTLVTGHTDLCEVKTVTTPSVPDTRPSDIVEHVTLTAAGEQQLQAELDHLRETTRLALIARARQARRFLAPEAAAGILDVTERDLAVVDGRIARLEATLANAEVVVEKPSPSMVDLGVPVTVRYEDGTSQTLMVVPSLEADLSRGHISSESPVGKALLGKAPGDKLTVEADGESIALQIDKIDSGFESA